MLAGMCIRLACLDCMTTFLCWHAYTTGMFRLQDVVLMLAGICIRLACLDCNTLFLCWHAYTTGMFRLQHVVLMLAGMCIRLACLDSNTSFLCWLARVYVWHVSIATRCSFVGWHVYRFGMFRLQHVVLRLAEMCIRLACFDCNTLFLCWLACV